MNGNRDGAIELYRCSLMFGICLLHVICQGGYIQRGVSDVLLSCVDGFVLISGWFGIKFSIGKMLRLFFVGVFCAAMLTGIDHLLFNSDGTPPFFIDFIHVLISYWFLWTYMALMLVAPIINRALQTISTSQDALTVFAPFWFLVFGWMYADTIPHLKDYVPTLAGFGPLTLLCLVGIYSFGHVFRLCLWDQWLFGWRLALLFAVCLVGAAIGCGHYHSVFALGLASCSFKMFRRLTIAKSMQRIILFISPSMFSIYLLHSHGKGFKIVWNLSHYFVEQLHVLPWLTWFVVAAIIFVAGLMIDLFRRMIVYAIKKAR